MDLTRKLDYAKQHVASISRHDDADLGLRSAALTALEQYIVAERAGMQKRLDARIAAMTAATGDTVTPIE